MLAHSNGFHAVVKIGHQLLRSLAADAYICIMVWIHCWGPPHGRTWQRSATGSGLRLVSCSLRCAGGAIAHAMGCCPEGQKRRGCHRPVLARFDLAVAISGIRASGDSPPARRRRRPEISQTPRAVRDGRNEGRNLPSALVGLPGRSTSSLCPSITLTEWP